MSKEAVVWSLPNCVMCNRTKEWLKDKGVVFEERDLMLPENAQVAAYFRSLDLMQAPIVEVLEQVHDDEPKYHTEVDRWAGFQPQKLDEHFGEDIWA